MPLSTHISALVEHLNSPCLVNTNSDLNALKFKHSHGYDLLATSCGLSKYEFQNIGFVASSLMPEIPAYQPYVEDLHSDILSSLRTEIKSKFELDENHRILLDIVIDRITRDGFNMNGSVIRHPHQLIVMLRDLYETDESIIEHLDSVIELIENLEFVDHKKNKQLLAEQYWILHWCYAVILKHESSIKKEIEKKHKLKAKKTLLLEMYQAYFERSKSSIEKYYEKCLQAVFDQAVEFHKALNTFLGTDFYESTHSFATVNRSQEYENIEENSKVTTNLFYKLSEVTFCEYEKRDSLYRLMNEANLRVENDDEKIILVLLERLFRNDVLGYADGGDWFFRGNYTHLFSDDFESNLKQQYPNLNYEWHFNYINSMAISIFSQMFRYYLKHQHFDGYQLPSIAKLVEI